jgi:hypothetical protein
MSFELLEREDFLIAPYEAVNPEHYISLAMAAGAVALQPETKEWDQNYLGAKLHELAHSTDSRMEYLQEAQKLFQQHPDKELRYGRDVDAFLRHAGPWRIKLTGSNENAMIILQRFTYEDDLARLSKRTKNRADGKKLEVMCETITTTELEKVCSIEIEVLNNLAPESAAEVPTADNTIDQTGVRLSPRKADILWLAYKDFTTITEELAMNTPQTVRVHLSQIRRLFKVATMEDLYVRAYQEGHIDPDSIPYLDKDLLTAADLEFSTTYWNVNGKKIAALENTHYSRVVRRFQAIYAKIDASDRKQLVLQLAKVELVPPVEQR